MDNIRLRAKYEAMSRIYYRGAKAAIVCYDIGSRLSWDRARFWLGELRRHEENCKIYICATKVDTEDIDSNPRQISKETATKYAQSIQAKYIETSSKTGENVEELFQLIADDFMSEPENVKNVEEIIMLTAKTKKQTCC